VKDRKAASARVRLAVSFNSSHKASPREGGPKASLGRVEGTNRIEHRGAGMAVSSG